MLYLFLFIFIVGTLFFSHILCLQLVEGKVTFRYLWLTPQFYYDLLQTILSRVYNSLEWGLRSPPKPHAFTSLPLQSNSLYLEGNFTFSSLICILILTVSACLTLHKLYLSYKIRTITRKGFLKCLFINLKSHPFKIFFYLLGLFIISYIIRTTTFSYLDLNREDNVCIFLIIIFSTWFPVMYVFNIARQFINSIRVPNVRIDLSIHNEQLNHVITVYNCFLVLAFATMSYYLTPLSFVMSFLGYDDSFSSRLVLWMNEEGSSSGVKIKSEDSSSNVKIKPEAGDESNENRPIVDLRYVMVKNTVKGSHVAIYDSLQPSGERLNNIFTTFPPKFGGPQPPLDEVQINGVKYTYVKKFPPKEGSTSELYKETTLQNTNEKGVWAKAFHQEHKSLDQYDIRSGNKELIRLISQRKMFIRE